MVNTAGPHSPMPLSPSTPIALIAMSVALVTSATSAMRPWKEIASAALVEHAGELGDDDRRHRRDRRARRGASSVDGAPSASAMPWYTSTVGETFDEPLGEQREPAFDRRGFRTHEEGRELGDDEHRARRPPPNPDAPARP